MSSFQILLCSTTSGLNQLDCKLSQQNPLCWFSRFLPGRLASLSVGSSRFMTISTSKIKKHGICGQEQHLGNRSVKPPTKQHPLCMCRNRKMWIALPIWCFSFNRVFCRSKGGKYFKKNIYICNETDIFC